MTGITGPIGDLPLHALFQKRIDGDDALLRLARRRFERAGLAAEVYAGSHGELAWVLGLTPRGARPPTVHLSRGVDLLEPDAREAVAGFVRRFGERVSGFVVHDRRGFPDRLDDLETAAALLSPVLVEHGTTLFVEYAAGLRLEQFVAIGDRLAGHDGLGLCLDTGHVGIREARRQFAPDLDVDLAHLNVADPRLPGLLDDVRAAVDAALPAVLTLTTALGAQPNPVHFHLHDGHPLIRGLSDHKSFLTRLPVPFGDADSQVHDRGQGQGQGHQACRSLPPLYGPAGAAAIVTHAVAAVPADRLSFTLEIHDVPGRLPLGEDADVVQHWQDVTNAERMNAWLEVLAQNAQLLTGR
jgi:hypothetical protein